MNLNNLFNPRSVAVIGASSDKNKVGYALVKNLVDAGDVGTNEDKKNTTGDKRTIYPVSISEKDILGLKTYVSIKDIPGDIDLALIAVRADIVPTVLEECAAKNIKSVIVISAGFREVGPAGVELENKVADIARQNDITLLGPNCLGTLDTHAGLNASFAASTPKKGHIAFLSQSGALGTAVIDKAIEEGIGFSKFISLGNEATLSELDFLEYLRDDKDTRAIIMYIEKLTDGPRFMKLAAEITRHKPVVLLRAGRGSRGMQAVMSHTGSLAPADAVFLAACKQSGIIAVNSIRELFNMAKLFELGVYKPLQNLVVLTNAGGPAVVTADLIDLSKSLSLIELKKETRDSLRKVLPSMAAFNNPVDIIGDALSTRYDSALKILVGEKEADAIVTLLTPQMMTEAGTTAQLLAKYNKEKPIFPVFLGGPNISTGLDSLKQNGLVNFAYPVDVVEALDNLARGAKKITANPPASHSRSSNSKTNSFAKMLSFHETCELFSKYNLEIDGILAKEKSDIKEAISKLATTNKHSATDKPSSDTYIIKAISPDVIHKTDMGAVKLNLKTVTEIESAWDEITSNIKTKNPQAIIEGMLLQTMTPRKEVIVGMKRDAIFGPTILFGLGGIFTEALKDTSLRIAPIEKETVLEMIHEIRGFSILSGLRGEKSCNIEALADIITQISKLSVDHPEISEIDLNPVMADSKDATIVDVRVMIG